MSHKEDTHMENVEKIEITKDTIISDVLAVAPDTAPLFQRIGMHCLGCALASGETVSEACMVHGVDPDQFIAALNSYIAATR